MTKKAIVFVTRNKNEILSDWQTYPFKFHERDLKKNLGLTIKWCYVENAKDAQDKAPLAKSYDVVFFRPSWKDEPGDVFATFQKLRQLIGPQKKLILIDPFDQTSSRFFDSLPLVDHLLKFICLRDVSLYTNDFIGGNYMTDRLANIYGIDIGDWHVGSKIAAGQESKITSSWFVVEPKIIKKINASASLAGKLFLSEAKKDLDVFCHISCGNRENLTWYGVHRSSAVDKLSELDSKYSKSIAAEYEGEKRISRSEYESLGKRSKIMVSPLGWGEVTMRPYEAILNRAMMIQPNAENVLTEPNVLIPFETYVPVKWDFSDLNEKVRYYLENDEERERIIANARKKFLEYYETKKFVDQISLII